MKKLPSAGPAQIAFIFLLSSALWIFATDTLLLKGFGDSLSAEALLRIQVFKGLFFVLATAALLYWLVRRSLARLRERDEELERLALYDPLTDLPNRLLLRERLAQLIGAGEGAPGRLVVLHLDLHDFKSVNDSLGHCMGDELLRCVARRLADCAPGGSLFGRPGGDEFLLVTPLAETQPQPRVQAVLECFKAPFFLENGRELFAQACAGISLYPDHGQDAELLLRRAETALYRAKQQGPERSCTFTPEMGSQVVERLELVTALRHAIGRGELLLHYQPMYRVADGVIAGGEALLRWQRAQGELVHPGQFIGLAELSGLISPIGERVLEETASQLRRWLDAGLAPVPVSVNVSARQFRDQNLPALLRALIERHGIPPRLLELEITESLLMEQPERVLEILASLKELGMRIAMDDFGTGFSSFSYLTRLPVDLLKIDISFIRKIGQSGRDDKVVSSMIDLAHHLGMQVVAEGVEQELQLDFLRARGCDFCQGFLFNPGLPAAGFTGLLSRSVD